MSRLSSYIYLDDASGGEFLVQGRVSIGFSETFLDNRLSLEEWCQVDLLLVIKEGEKRRKKERK